MRIPTRVAQTLAVTGGKEKSCIHIPFTETLFVANMLAMTPFISLKRKIIQHVRYLHSGTCSSSDNLLERERTANLFSDLNTNIFDSAFTLVKSSSFILFVMLDRKCSIH